MHYLAFVIFTKNFSSLRQLEFFINFAYVEIEVNPYLDLNILNIFSDEKCLAVLSQMNY